MTLDDLRKEYHDAICRDLLRMNKNQQKGDYPNNADGDSRISVSIAKEIYAQLGPPQYATISVQNSDDLFAILTKDFIEKCFNLLNHLRPGNWRYYLKTEISQFEQYKDFAEMDSFLKEHKELATTIGQAYIPKPDILIGREPLTDNEINKYREILSTGINRGKRTPLRQANNPSPKPILFAAIFCPWTLGLNQAQRIKFDAISLINKRKGKAPQIAGVTAETNLLKIASLAFETGELDCVYHFALNELKNAITTINDESQLDMYKTLVEGRRLRDISDLPFDLAV
ncbi:MAG TPA: NgoMIV family type II restriction endonuclease [bacterium]|nr:NgoMIV family type II restriction endonuclease [bacterium]HPN42618.1 NgoMIV family type II restriction endonuclease [bacterium]